MFEGTAENFDWENGISFVPRGTQPGFRANTGASYRDQCAFFFAIVFSLLLLF